MWHVPFRSAVLERKIEAYESRLSDFQSKKNGDLEALRIIAELENKLQEKENERQYLEFFIFLLLVKFQCILCEKSFST